MHLLRSLSDKTIDASEYCNILVPDFVDETTFEDVVSSVHQSQETTKGRIVEVLVEMKGHLASFDFHDDK